MAGKTFVQHRRLNWGEADPAGTIYAPRAIDFAIQAIESLWIEATGLSFREWQTGHGKGTPWVHTACDFVRPLRAGETFVLNVSLEKIGAASFTWRGTATRPDGDVLFRLKLVAVMIDLATGESCAIPDDVRAAFSSYVA